MPKKLNGVYSDRMKAIRSFVDFSYDLRKRLHSSQKAKINRYFNAIDNIQARANKVYRSTNKKRVRIVQRASRNEFEKLPGIKVAFYESSKANPAKIRFRNDKLRITHEFFVEQYIEFDIQNLARNADAEIDRALSKANKKAKWFRVNAGRFTIASPRTKARIKPFIRDLQKRYSEIKDDENLANNHWQNWMHGITTLEPQNQTELSTFLRAEAKEKDVRERKRRAAKRKREGVTKNSRLR